MNAIRAETALGLVAAGSIAAVAAAQDAIQWREQDGGNGNWYRIVLRPYARYNWTATRAEAQATAGDLASFETPAEWIFMRARCRELPAGTMTAFLAGGVRQAGASASWTWLTGDSFAYHAWNAGAPNDGTGQSLVLCVGSGIGGPSTFDGWDDWRINDLSSGFIVEWSADCNNDGIVDFGQIRAGELDDLNANNIPDCCESASPCSCPGDLDRSGEVNGVDLAIILQAWGGSKQYPEADIDGDGTVGGTDLAVVLNGWGACP